MNCLARSVLAVCLMAAGFSFGVAQQQTPPANANTGAKVDAENAARESENRILNKQARGAGDKFMREVKNPRASNSNPNLVMSEDLLLSSERKRLEPAAEDRQQFAVFLRQPDSGIFKLLTAEHSTATGAVSVEELKEKKPVLSLFGGGAYFSFTKRKHDLTEWVDISISNGKLKTGIAGVSLGAMTIIGNVPLDLVKPDSFGVAPLARLVPPTDFSAANNQFAQNATGYEVEGLIYKSTMPIVLNQVYVLRSTLYQRSDQLIAFRIIRQDKDGALTIIWKKLGTYPASKLNNIPKENRLWLATR